MPRFTPLRVILSLFFCWLLLAFLWAALPSPPCVWNDDPSDYVASGKTLTRVYEIKDFFPHTDHLWSVIRARETGRQSFGLDYTLTYHAKAHSMHLQIGEINGFNLTRYASVPTPYLSPPYDVAVKTGDQDGINLPWFARADSTLLFWDIHHDLAFMRFRLRVVDGNTVEIWPESSVWNEHDPQMTPALPPLLVLTNVSVAAAGSIKVQLPHGVLNSSPSQTFVVRRVIGSMLVPSGLLLSEAMAWTYPAIVCMLTWVHVVINISGIYAVVVLVWWCLKGRPPFWQWMRSFWLTRGLIVCLGPLEQKRSTIWSATGPVEDEDEAGLDDTAIVGPRPLSNATDFFRSSSPLDDLLFTFESTRHLVQPLMFRRRGQDGPRSMSVRRFIQLDPTNHRFGKDIEAGNMAPWLSEKSRS